MRANLVLIPLLLVSAACPQKRGGGGPAPAAGLGCPAAQNVYIASYLTPEDGAKEGHTGWVLPLHDKVHFLTNMKSVERSAGLWNTALPIANAMSFHDDQRCKTFTEIIVTEGGKPYVIGTRLYLHEGKVIRVDSLVTEPGHWLFNANAFLRYTKQEDWTPLFKYQLTDPAEMIRGANAYLDGFSDKFTDIPWGTPCARLEGGAYTNRSNDPHASCELGMPPGVLYITHRDYLVDQEMGVINVFCRFGGREEAPDSHTFRYIDGKFRQIHTLTAIPGPQASDDGGMVRGAADPNAS